MEGFCITHSLYEHFLKYDINDAVMWEAPLPDSASAGEDLNWEAGATDNIFLHNAKLEPPDRVITAMIRCVGDIAVKDCAESKNELKSIVKHWRTIHLVDQFIKTLLNKSSEMPVNPYLCRFARHLAFESDEREAVKLGISMLGVLGCCEADVHRIKILGRHEEFTLYCVVSLHSLLDNADAHIWELAQQTFGWGRINCVEQLRYTTDKEIKRWLLHEGYANSVMNEYTAYICAVAGDLKNALAADIIEDRLLDSSCEIINSLLIDGPAQGMDDYRDAPAVCASYVRHVGLKGKGVKHFALLLRIRSYIENPMADWSKRKGGWEKSACDKLLSRIDAVLNKPEWRKDLSGCACMNSLETSDDVLLTANYLGLDMWVANWNKLLSNPLNPSYWREIFRLVTDERAGQVAEYMKEIIPWVDMVSDDSQEGYCHYAVDEILRGICRFSGMGGELLFHLLSKASPRHRMAVVKVLACWGQDGWPGGMHSALFEAYETENDLNIKTGMGKLLGL